MDREIVYKILERILDDLCDTEGVYATIERLIEIGVEDDELRELKFDIKDIERTHEIRLERELDREHTRQIFLGDKFYG